MVRWVLCLLGGLVLSGCSAIFVSGPPSDHAQRQYFDCSSDWAGPATDGMFGVTYGLVTVMAAANPESVSGDGELEARLKQADSQRPDATVPAPVLAPAPPPPLEMPTPAPAAPVAPPATDPLPSGPLH